jgi:hypothetical protein
MRFSRTARQEKFAFVFSMRLAGRSIRGERLGRFGFICAPSTSRGRDGERAADPLHRVLSRIPKKSIKLGPLIATLSATDAVVLVDADNLTAHAADTLLEIGGAKVPTDFDEGAWSTHACCPATALLGFFTANRFSCSIFFWLTDPRR